MFNKEVYLCSDIRLFMKVDCIPYEKTGYFSDLMCDYLKETSTLQAYYNNFPKLQNFKKQLKEKAENFPMENRKVLVNSLNVQYKDSSLSKRTQNNISLLGEADTFTIVTGHQLNLFTGPLYFLYKILSVINLTETLKKEHPKNNFVPIYWMATEDHDFDEINFFNFKGKKLQWNHDASGGVGRLQTDGLEEVFETFSNVLGVSKNALELKKLFKKAYLEHNNLTDATRFLANELFGEYGLVIVDGDDKELKKLLIPYAKEDLIKNTAFTEVSKTIDTLSEVSDNYKIQVNPREINYFYLVDDIRERIIKADEKFKVNNTDIEFSEQEILKELEEFPERFSPNVIARPLYQEVILPNLCYIGGGGELAYWLELKSFFNSHNVTFPMLLLRNSVLVITEKQAEKIKKLDLSVKDLFLKQNTLVNKKIREISNINIDFSEQKNHLGNQFAEMHKLAKQTDKSFLGAVKAQEKKQLKGLDALEKRLLQAQKRKLKDHVERLVELQNAIFPNQSLQERNTNFADLYLEYGEELIIALKKNLNPLLPEFTTLTF